MSVSYESCVLSGTGLSASSLSIVQRSPTEGVCVSLSVISCRQPSAYAMSTEDARLRKKESFTCNQ